MTASVNLPRDTCAGAAAPALSRPVNPLGGVPQRVRGAAPVGIASACLCIATGFFGPRG